MIATQSGKAIPTLVLKISFYRNRLLAKYGRQVCQYL